MPKLSEWLMKPISIQPPVSHQEKLLAGGTALVSMAALVFISQFFAGSAAVPFMVASMGASAVLLFAAPHSPLAQPWPFVAGHLVSAVVGVTCYQWVPDPLLAASAAVAIAIVIMLLLRCLHPPGGATALAVVLGGAQVHELGYGFLLVPLAPNLVVLLAAALLLNNLLPGRRFPVWIPATSDRTGASARRSRPMALTEDDLRSAMEDMGAFIDVTADDLNRIYGKASLHALKRRMGEVRARDIMTPEVVSVQYGTELEETWAMMREHGLKGVPVVDPAERVIGIITIVDFLKRVDTAAPGRFFQRLADFIRRTPDVTARKPEAVGQIMTSHVITAHENDHILSLVPLFSQHNIHHLPVIDDDRRLTGIVTQSDVMSALSQFQFGEKEKAKPPRKRRLRFKRPRARRSAS